jgi:SAM-dependent methyltransferase
MSCSPGRARSSSTCCRSNDEIPSVRSGLRMPSLYGHFCCRLRHISILAGLWQPPCTAATDMNPPISPHGCRRCAGGTAHYGLSFPFLYCCKRISSRKSARVRSYRPKVSPEFSLFALQRRLRSTRKLLDALIPPARASRWSGYTRTACHYGPEDHTAKQEFVHQSLQRIRPARVLDVGANTGVYSRIAAESGADVVAWDTDLQAADLNWQAASRDGLSILSMVADFARPTPAVGWQNSENASLLSRADQRFDCVIMLGVLHHLLVADQIPMESIVGQLAQISTRWAILEWIPVEDSQFAELCRGREGLYRHLTEEYFVETISTRFAVRNRGCLPNGRTLWLVEKTQ